MRKVLLLFPVLKRDKLRCPELKRLGLPCGEQSPRGPFKMESAFATFLWDSPSFSSQPLALIYVDDEVRLRRRRR